MEETKWYTINEWVENFANLMAKYDYKRGKSITKIQKITESTKEKELEELFKDIQSFFKISIEPMPENVYLFIFEVIKELSNNKANDKHLEKIVGFLLSIPTFYENFCKILKCHINKNDQLLVLNRINSIQQPLIEKWDSNFKSFKDKYFKKNKQKTKLQEIAKSGKEKELNKLLEDIQSLFTISIELMQEQKIYSLIFTILKELYSNKIETNAEFLKKIFEFLNKIPNFNENLEEYLKQNEGDVELFKQIEFFANEWDKYFVDLKKQYNYVGYDFKQEQEKPKRKDKQLRQKEENLEEEPQIEINYNSDLIDDIRNIFNIQVELIPDEVYLFISRVILDLSKINEPYFKKVITLLYDISYFNKCFKNILKTHSKFEELNTFNEEVNKIKQRRLRKKVEVVEAQLIERSRSVSNENTPLNQSLKDINNLTSSLNDSLRENQKKDQKIQELIKENERLEEDNKRLKKELLSKSLPTKQTESKRQVKQFSLFNKQGQMRQTSSMKKCNLLKIGIHINGTQSPRIRNENQSSRQYEQYFSFGEEEEEMKEEKDIKEMKEEIEKTEEIINKNQQKSIGIMHNSNNNINNNTNTNTNTNNLNNFNNSLNGAINNFKKEEDEKLRYLFNINNK